MSRREFQLVEGASKKFWTIELRDKAHTVTFGRLGTTGQTQTRKFDSAEAAKKSCEKLIAEKEKKGYVEVTAAPAGSAPAKPVTTKKVAKSEAAGVAAPPAEPPKAAAPPPPPAHTDVTRVIELEPEDGILPVRRKPEAAAKPPARPFDLSECLDRVRTVPVTRWGWHWDWSRAGIPASMTREEAQFWFTAMTTLEQDEITKVPTSERSKVLPKRLADRLAGFEPRATFSLDDATAGLQRTPQTLTASVVQPLANLFTPDELLDFIQGTFTASKHGAHWDGNIRAVLIDGFCRHVVPFLSDREVRSLEARIRPAVNAANWPTDHYRRPSVEFFLAALLGMSEELAAVVRALPDGHYAPGDWDHSHYHQTQRIVFGLGDPKAVEAEMRRLKLPLRTPGLMRTWLVVTRFDGLDYARDNILAETRKDECEELLKVFARVKAPEATPRTCWS